MPCAVHTVHTEGQKIVRKWSAVGAIKREVRCVREEVGAAWQTEAESRGITGAQPHQGLAPWRDRELHSQRSQGEDP